MKIFLKWQSGLQWRQLLDHIQMHYCIRHCCNVHKMILVHHEKNTIEHNLLWYLRIFELYTFVLKNIWFNNNLKRKWILFALKKYLSLKITTIHSSHYSFTQKKNTRNEIQLVKHLLKQKLKLCIKNESTNINKSTPILMNHWL